MSLWLSAANSYTGAARSAMAADTSRAQAAMTKEMTRQAMAFWFPFAPSERPAAPKKRPARRRSRAMR